MFLVRHCSAVLVLHSAPHPLMPQPPSPHHQVLVYHDLLGMMQHPHHAKVTPKFCKQYSAVGRVIQEVNQPGQRGL